MLAGGAAVSGSGAVAAAALLSVREMTVAVGVTAVTDLTFVSSSSAAGAG